MRHPIEGGAESAFTRRQPYWQPGLVLVLALAMTLRLVGIDFGLPLQLHPDEWSQVDIARRMLGGDLNPHFFRYSSLAMYQLFTIYGSMELLRLAGFALSAPVYFLTGRLLSALYGTATVGVVFWIGGLIWKRSVGMMAALLTAVSPIAVQQAHYATVDTALVFWTTLALAFGLLAYRKPAFPFLPAGIAAGLAAGTKYTGILMLPPLVLLILWRHEHLAHGARTNIVTRGWMAGIALLGGILLFGFVWFPPSLVENLARAWTTDGALNVEYVNLIRSSWGLAQALGVGLTAMGLTGLFSTAVRHRLAPFFTRELIWFLLAVACAFLITSPFVILDLPEAARDFFYEYRHMQLGIAADYAVNDPIYARLLPTTFFPDPWYYWNSFLSTNSWLMVAATVAGIIGLTRKNLTAFGATSLLFLTTVFAIMHGAYKADRYVLVLLPTIYLWAGSGIETLVSLLGGSRRLFAQATLVGVIAFFPVLAVSTMLSNVFMLPDTRTLAWKWIQTHVPPGTTVVREINTPDLEDVEPRLKIIVTTSAFQELTLDTWQQQRVNYFVTGTQQLWYGQEEALYPEIARRYRQLDEHGALIAEFRSDAGQSIGPLIRIYHIP